MNKVKSIGFTALISILFVGVLHIIPINKKQREKDFYNLVWRRAIIEYKDYRKYYQKIRNGAC